MKIKLVFILLLSFTVTLLAENVIRDSVFISDSLANITADTSLIVSKEDSSSGSAIQSIGEDLSQIIPDSEVKQKLTDIFSLGKIIWAIIFTVLSFYFIKIVVKIIDRISEKSARYRITLKGTIPIVRIIGWTIVLNIIVIVIFAPPIESLVVVTGSLGLAVGFAAQDILKNIFGGIMIIFDRPFQVGDKVEIGEYYGEVTSIGLRSTRIVTPDDSLVSIPNGDIMSKALSNSNAGEANCQVVAEIYLPVYVDTAKVREIAIQAAKVSKYVYLNKPITVIFKNEVHQGRSFLKMRLKAYVLDIRYEFVFMSEMTEITVRELLNNNLVSRDELIGLKGNN